MAKPTLRATSDDHDAVWGAINKVRKGAGMVKVPKDTLTNVMLDHGALMNIHNGKFKENGE